MVVNKCPSCGAPIVGCVCDYCGSIDEEKRLMDIWAKKELNKLYSDLAERYAELRNRAQTNYMLERMSRWTI